MAQLPMVQIISEIDEFKGQFRNLQNIPRDKLNSLRKIATIESVGSSTSIDGVKLSDKEVQALLEQGLQMGVRFCF